MKFCGYCKAKGWPGTSHNEVDCRTKKRDVNQQNSQEHPTPSEELPEPRGSGRGITPEQNSWANCFHTSDKIRM